MTEVAKSQVGTGEAAAALGVDRRTLTRWANRGAVTPASTTVGGYMRWDLDQLREQLRTLGVVPPGSPTGSESSGNTPM